MKKRFSLAICIMMIFALTMLSGCGTNVDDSVGTDVPTPSEQQSEEPASSESPETSNEGTEAVTPNGGTSTDENVAASKASESGTNSADTTIQADSSSSALSAYKSVLKNDSPFFNTDDNKNLSLNQLSDSFGDASMKITKFAVVDLDNDGTPEVVLWETVNGNDYGVEVLRYQNGTIYGYSFVYRAFNNLKTDGTFRFSSSAANSGFGTVNFNDGSNAANKITYCELSSDSNDPIYFVNNTSATADEFDSAMSEQDMKADVKWYDLTEENIETMLSDSK